MNATATITETATIVVKVEICHGDYRASFYGDGATVLEAAEAAAIQSSYSMGLFDSSDYFYALRSDYRKKLQAKLEARESYRGFGWCDFSRVA